MRVTIVRHVAIVPSDEPSQRDEVDTERTESPPAAAMRGALHSRLAPRWSVDWLAVRLGSFLPVLLLAGASALAVSPGQRVSGHVSGGNFCSSDGSAVAVELTPTGRVAIADTDGRFAFDDVADGDYVLTFGTLAFPLRLTIAGRDESVQLCLDCPSALRVEPRHGLPGSIATAVGGGCYALHSGRWGTITFDGDVIGRGGGSQLGDFRTRILVPHDTAPGPHRLLLLGSPGEVGAIASDQFIVDAGPPPCAGDCNGDGTVTVAEILGGVGQLLDRFGVTCAAYPDVVTVDMVVDAVAAALGPCGPPRAEN